MTRFRIEDLMKLPIVKVFSLAIVALLLAASALAEDSTARFKVTGVICEACQIQVEKALAKTDGVKSAKVDIAAASALVAFDNAKVSTDQIIKVIEKQGFKAELQKK